MGAKQNQNMQNVPTANAAMAKTANTARTIDLFIVISKIWARYEKECVNLVRETGTKSPGKPETRLEISPPIQYRLNHTLTTSHIGERGTLAYLNQLKDVPRHSDGAYGPEA